MNYGHNKYKTNDELINIVEILYIFQSIFSDYAYILTEMSRKFDEGNGPLIRYNLL